VDIRHSATVGWRIRCGWIAWSIGIASCFAGCVGFGFRFAFRISCTKHDSCRVARDLAGGIASRIAGCLNLRHSRSRGVVIACRVVISCCVSIAGCVSIACCVGGIARTVARLLIAP
jgi:hypothetical protein